MIYSPIKKNAISICNKIKIFKTSDLICQRDFALHICLDHIYPDTVQRLKQEKYENSWGSFIEINELFNNII